MKKLTKDQKHFLIFYFSSHQTCEVCGNPAVTVDYKRHPNDGGPEKADCNVISLCDRCYGLGAYRDNGPLYFR